MKWFIKCLRQYADFTGRARRKEYWMFNIYRSLIFLLTIIFCALLAGILSETNPKDGLWLVLVPIIVYLLFIIPSLAVAVRRMHDVGHSGWFLFINLIPSIGSLVYFIFTLFDSQPCENKWGVNPKEKDNNPKSR